MDRELELSLIRLLVLAEAERSPIYGSRLLEELTRRGYRLGFGTLYPLLHRLETGGLLAREDRLEGGRVRKYYRTTPAGESALARSRQRLADIQRELAAPSGEPTVASPEPVAPLI